jgi:SAM-dependent methyltransferase
MSFAGTPRYDGLADWYDEFNAPAAANNAEDLVHLLGPGHGSCLDLGCGTGQYLKAIESTGRTVVGVDLSADQLRLAQSRAPRVARADMARLPFRDGAFRTVTAMWISTDVEDVTAVLAEAARVLEPAGMLLFSGVHPCFNGPQIEARDDDARIIHPTYREAGWHAEAPWWGENIRRRVGMRHVPLAELLNGFAAAGLIIDHVVEPERTPIPWALTIRAFKPPLTFRMARPLIGG